MHCMFDVGEEPLKATEDTKSNAGEKGATSEAGGGELETGSDDGGFRRRKTTSSASSVPSQAKSKLGYVCRVTWSEDRRIGGGDPS